jgi:hypothetical protein
MLFNSPEFIVFLLLALSLTGNLGVLGHPLPTQ